MPELPEVETVARGMAHVLEGHTIKHVVLNRASLRWPIPSDLPSRVEGAQVLSVTRRAKYALINTNRNDSLILHLGMSGRIKRNPETLEKHDHVVFTTEQGDSLVFCDPRRFGALDITPTHALASHKLLAQLGPEPLGNAFHADYLAQSLQGRQSTIKALLFDQSRVAGLGNIYICEALFWAGIAPTRTGASLAFAEITRLVEAIRTVLTNAIQAGGSSLRDYTQVDGALGYFQHAWAVYGREAETCRVCQTPIMRITQNNRSTFFCPTCQPSGDML
jgi:formamidopyrimidine-DNA glycosylase